MLFRAKRAGTKPALLLYPQVADGLPILQSLIRLRRFLKLLQGENLLVAFGGIQDSLRLFWRHFLLLAGASRLSLITSLLRLAGVLAG